MVFCTARDAPIVAFGVGCSLDAGVCEQELRRALWKDLDSRTSTRARAASFMSFLSPPVASDAQRVTPASERTEFCEWEFGV